MLPVLYLTDITKFLSRYCIQGLLAIDSDSTKFYCRECERDCFYCPTCKAETHVPERGKA